MYKCTCCQYLNIPPHPQTDYVSYTVPSCSDPHNKPPSCSEPHRKPINTSRTLHPPASKNFYIDHHPQKRFNYPRYTPPSAHPSLSTAAQHQPNNLNLPCSVSQPRKENSSSARRNVRYAGMKVLNASDTNAWNSDEIKVRNNNSNPGIAEFYHHYEEVDLEDDDDGMKTPVSDDNNENLIDEFFDGLESEIAWSVAVCERVFNLLSESGSGWSDDDQLSDAPVAPTRTESIKQPDSTKSGTHHELNTSFHIWYQPDLSRENAEDLLVRQPVGTFYIRNSSREDYHALSVHISLVSPRVEHYLVHDKGNCLQMDSSNLEFPNFVELLSFFTKSNTYSATTGIPVQLKIPRFISSSACSSVYDKISLQEPRSHSQSKDVPIPRDLTAAGNKVLQSAEQKTERRHSYNATHQSTLRAEAAPGSGAGTGVTTDGTPGSRGPRPVKGGGSDCRRSSAGYNNNIDKIQAERPKSVHVSNSCEITKMRDIKGIAPPKPPKPKNYRGNNFVEEDLIYINLDKSPDKDMINIMGSADGMPCCITLSDEEKNNAKNNHLNNQKGPAIFYAPPPPSTSPTDNIAEFIAPSPPCTPPSDDSEVEDNDIGSSLGSLYSNKNSLSNESLRMKRTNPRPVSVMEKVRSRVFKMERSSRQSVRAKLCNKLSSHILRLTDSHDFTFAARCSTFVTFVKQQHESKPDRLLLQIREFMCNLKHEMITYRHETLDDILSRAQRKRPPPKLNDIVEGVLVKAVILPLRNYIAKVLLDYDQQEAVKLKNSMTIALSKSMEELGINKELFCGQDVDWTVPVEYLRDITNHYSPIKKLERLLACVNAIYTIIRDINMESTGKPRSMGADEFLPLFIYVLALSSVADIGQELLFIQGLLDPPLLIGEPGYYLTTLASSIMLLQSLDFEKSHKILPTVGHLQSMLQIYFTDSDMEQIAYKTLPIHQNTTTQDLLETLAAKFRIDDISEYGLFKVEEGTEVRLESSECPQYIKNRWLVESLERDINAFFTFHKLNI